MLSDQVLTSPEKRATENSKRQISENKTNLEDLKTSVSQFRAKLAELPKVDRMLDLLVESFSAITDDLKQQEKLCNDKDNIASRISQANLNLNAKSRQLIESKEYIATKLEKMSKMTQKLSLQIKQCDAQIVEIKKKICDYEVQMGKNEVESMELDEEYKNVRSEINKLNNEHNELIKLCNKKRDAIFLALELSDKKAEKSIVLDIEED